jgi:transcription elongation factor GreA
MTTKVPITARGATALQDELKRLKTVDRPRVIQAIADARAHGDLKENAEYHAAREQQSFMEGRIAEIEAKLANCQVIDPAALAAGDKVVFGATVDIADEDSGHETTYQIVGEDEADIKAGRLSYTSPIARALIGKSEGDVVSVTTPGGAKSLEVLAVRYE